MKTSSRFQLPTVSHEVAIWKWALGHWWLLTSTVGNDEVLGNIRAWFPPQDGEFGGEIWVVARRK